LSITPRILNVESTINQLISLKDNFIKEKSGTATFDWTVSQDIVVKN